MKLLFIINPIAGKGKTKDAIPIIYKFCNDRGILYEVKETHFPGNATDMVLDAVTHGYSAIVAVGGDGTVLEVANGLIGTSLPLGIIPLGAGNDFARALNIPIGFEHIVDSIKIITESVPIQVDIGKFTDRFFLNIASVGFDAEIIRDLHTVKRFIKGSAAYPLSVFLKFLTYKPKDVTLTIDGKTIKTKIFLAAICNGICYGGGMLINPNGSVTDGYFDLILVKPIARYKIPLLLSKFIKGLHLKLPYVVTYRCKEVEILSTEALAVNIDGECASTIPIAFNMIPLSIHVYGAL